MNVQKRMFFIGLLIWAIFDIFVCLYVLFNHKGQPYIDNYLGNLVSREWQLVILMTSLIGRITTAIMLVMGILTVFLHIFRLKPLNFILTYQLTVLS